MNLSLIPEYATATSGDTNNIYKGNEDQSQKAATKAVIKEASGQNNF